MGSRERFYLYVQYLVGRLAVLAVAPFVYLSVRLFGYRVRDLKRVRRECRLLFKHHKGPWIICANHLTNIDSVILAYAIAPMHRYMTSFRLLPWNLPERANFQRNIFSTVMCYLTKCIPVSRGGEREEMKIVLEKCIYILERKQNLLIFPEGGRSRTGRVNTQSFSYGVGRFVNAVDNCKVLCVYMRGDSQKNYSTIPRLRERFSITVDVLDPEKTDQTGLRAQRHYAEQIIKHLAKMEESYFAARRQRHSGFNSTQCEGQDQGYPFPETRISS
ncbi:MAG: 1-acyl-sn-glycerol-3-phosphate acyltransferase [Syntrophales bacterium LBB04]|nr:1-acyl-sn-glycerol-3-phosphate acyltransferase [Syntrophales bacterium LBB04]